EPTGVLGTDQDVVPAGAREGIGLRVDHAVELLAAPRREPELARLRPGAGRRPVGREAAAPVGRGANTVGAEMGTAVLERVALPREPLDAVVGRDHARDLLADGGGAREADPARQLGADASRQLAQHLELGLRLDRPR